MEKEKFEESKKIVNQINATQNCIDILENNKVTSILFETFDNFVKTECETKSDELYLENIKQQHLLLLKSDLEALKEKFKSL